MGIDTYASTRPDEIVLTPEQEHAFKAAQIELCGGLFSGGCGSFRGKIYIILILEITGESLFQEWIPPENVKRMDQALQNFYRAHRHRIEALQGYRSPPDEGEEQVSPNEDRSRSLPEDLDLPELQDLGELCRFFKVCADHDLGLINWG